MIINAGIQNPATSEDGVNNRVRNEILSHLHPIRNRISNIKVDLTENVVTISGFVASYYDRQLCLMSVRKVSNFLQINDLLQVRN